MNPSLRAAVAAGRRSPDLRRLFPISAAVGVLHLFPPPCRSRGFSALAFPPAVEEQFVSFRSQLEESGSFRERVRAVTIEIEGVVRLLQSIILLVHQSLPVTEAVEKANVQISRLNVLYGKLAEIFNDYPSQYYRYHGNWHSETQIIVSLIGFLHWLETGNLLLHSEAVKKLGLNSSELGLDTEDYLAGLCFMSNALPRYVVNRVTSGDYDCPRKVLKFLTDLHAAFGLLNLRNDNLRKKFDGMKYDLTKVETVLYDVKIRGLLPEEMKQSQANME